MPGTSQFVKNLHRFRLVTFDITDTLLTFRKPPGEQYAETAAVLGIKVDQKCLEQCFRQEFKTMATQHPNFGFSTPNMNWQQWWIVLVENIFRCVDSRIPDEKLRLVAETLMRQYRTNECWTHIEGNKELLKKIHDAGKCVGVISNFDSSLNQVLREMEIDSKFDFVLTSYDVGVLKPNSKIFDVPLERYNMNAGEALHIGNLYDVDYMGARNAGWCSLLVMKGGFHSGAATEKPSMEFNETHVYKNLMDLLKALETTDIKW